MLPSLQVPLGDALKSHDEVAEAGAGQPEIVDYQAIETRILNPVRDAYALIVKLRLAGEFNRHWWKRDKCSLFATPV